MQNAYLVTSLPTCSPAQVTHWDWFCLGKDTAPALLPAGRSPRWPSSFLTLASLLTLPWTCLALSGLLLLSCWHSSGFGTQTYNLAFVLVLTIHLASDLLLLQMPHFPGASSSLWTLSDALLSQSSMMPSSCICVVSDSSDYVQLVGIHALVWHPQFHST